MFQVMPLGFCPLPCCFSTLTYVMKIRQPKNVISNVFTLVLNTLKFSDPHREHLCLLKEFSEKLSKPLIKLINVCVK